MFFLNLYYTFITYDGQKSNKQQAESNGQRAESNEQRAKSLASFLSYLNFCAEFFKVNVKIYDRLVYDKFMTNLWFPSHRLGNK